MSWRLGDVGGIELGDRVQRRLPRYPGLLDYTKRIRRFSTPPPPPTSSRTKPYIQALQRLSARTNTPLPSLILSFGILHELTSIVPLFGLFFASRSIGAGDKLVEMVGSGEEGDAGWVASKCREYMVEGEAWAGRVGRRYGVFGFEKGNDQASSNVDEGRSRLAGDVANAVLAYGIVKAILPLRIGLSLYLSPAFSRGVIEPLRRGVINIWPRGRKP